MGCKNLCSLSPFGAEGPPLLKPFVQNPLFKTLCSKPLVFNKESFLSCSPKKEREKKEPI